MNKRQFLQLIDRYYFNYDLREIRVTIWTGQSSSFKFFDSWISIDCYTEDNDFIQEIDDYIVDMYSNIPEIRNIDKATEEEKKELKRQQQKLYLKIKKWIEGYNIIVKKVESNV